MVAVAGIAVVAVVDVGVVAGAAVGEDQTVGALAVRAAKVGMVN